MNERFEPELGQMCWSNTPWGGITLDDASTEVLSVIGEEVAKARLTENSPCGNTGEKYEGEKFKIRAYCWCDGDVPGHSEGCPPNFEWRDWWVTWYKYLGRSSAQNRVLTNVERTEMLRECFAEITARGRP